MMRGGSWRAIGRSLKSRNFRLYVTGQGISHAGMWIQMVAELWLIAELTDSGTALAMHSVLRFAPILIFGVFTGLIGDRADRRKLLLTTQGLHTLSTATLAVVVWISTPSLLLIYGIVLIQGCINAVDNPVRRSFIRDLAPDHDISNAVSLHNTVSTTARAIGPAVSGLLIASAGVEWCFTVNAISYLAVLLSLLLIDTSSLRRVLSPGKGPGQLRAGFRYAWSNRRIRITLMLTFLMTVFAWQWPVILPVYTQTEFLGDARLFGSLVSVLSVGSVLGALYSAKMPRLGGRQLRTSGFALSLALFGAAIAPTLPVAFASVALIGAAGSAFNVSAQSRVQLAVQDGMTSRVMALYSVGFAGSKPIGGLVAGAVMDLTSARGALVLGGVVLGVAIGAYTSSARRRRGPIPIK